MLIIGKIRFITVIVLRLLWRNAREFDPENNVFTSEMEKRNVLLNICTPLIHSFTVMCVYAVKVCHFGLLIALGIWVIHYAREKLTVGMVYFCCLIDSELKWYKHHFRTSDGRTTDSVAIITSELFGRITCTSTCVRRSLIEYPLSQQL